MSSTGVIDESLVSVLDFNCHAIEVSASLDQSNNLCYLISEVILTMVDLLI